jgi:predicted nuclease of predicted toxin-antitoxin system
VLLAHSNETGPGVIQIRTPDTMPDKIGNIIVSTIKKYEDLLVKGALVSMDKVRSRLRVLPLNNSLQ